MSTGGGFFGAGASDDDSGRQSEPSSEQQSEEGTFADVMNGFSMSSGRRRRKRKKRDPFEEQAGAATATPPPAPVEQPEPQAQANSIPSEGPMTLSNVVRPNGARDTATPPTPAPRRADEVDDAVREWPENPAGSSRFVLPEPATPLEDTGFVRPYALTGGRTKSNYNLELETLISTNQGVGTETVPDQIEHRSIVEECQTPRSVAEIAALLRVPLGVARVLVSDAADAGYVTVHKTISGSDGAEAHFTLMERVLSGLRRL